MLVLSELDPEPGKNYVDKLTIPAAKRRYSEKIVDIDGIDPYKILTRPRSANLDLLPDATYISNFFV